VRKGSVRANIVSGEPSVALRRPRWQSMRAEQQAEAVALLSELLLAAARRGADGHNLPTDGAEGFSRRRALAAGELARNGVAA
jgi:hypothetical protein